MNARSSGAGSWTVFQRTLIYIAAAGLSLLALRWLYLFVLTDYRSHHRPIIIPLALATLFLAVGLFRLSSAAVILLLMLAAGAAVAALYVQISAAFFEPFLVAVALGSIVYCCALIPPFIKAPNQTRQP